jgi:hypothetical protein
MASLGLQGFAVGTPADDEPGTDAPPGYASPRDAFEARRKALARRDWRTVFASSTPEVQDAEVMVLGQFWIYIEDGMEGGPFDGLPEAERRAGMARMRAVMKKHGWELQELWAEHDERYLAAHGVDRAKIVADLRKRGRERMEEARKKATAEERKEFDDFLKEHPEAVDEFILLPGEKPNPPVPEPDLELFFKIMEARLTDKAGFYEEASEIFTPKPKTKDKPGDADAFGDLKGLIVTGDSAKGWIVWNRSQMVNGTRDVWPAVRVLRKFRRLDGRWYNDDASEDRTRFDAAEAVGVPIAPTPVSGGAERRRP